MIIEIYCWKCLKEGIETGFPLYKVGNSYIFACKKHKDLLVEDSAYSRKEKNEND